MHIGLIALVALGITGSDKGTEADILIDQLGSCHSVSNQACLVAAARLTLLKHEALPRLERRFWTFPPEGQLLALGVVGGNEEERATELLAKIATDRRPHPSVRALALDDLGSRRYASYLKLLFRSTRDEANIVRAAAARGLSNHLYANDTKVLARLMALARDEAPNVRVEALFGLGFSGHAKAGKPLTRGLRDEDVEVRRAAAEGLGLIKHPPAVAELVKLLDDKDERLVRTVVRALRHQTDQEFGRDGDRWRQWLAEQKKSR